MTESSGIARCAKHYGLFGNGLEILVLPIVFSNLTLLREVRQSFYLNLQEDKMIELTDTAVQELKAYFESKEIVPIRVYLAPGG